MARGGRRKVWICNQRDRESKRWLKKVGKAITPSKRTQRAIAKAIFSPSSNNSTSYTRSYYSTNKVAPASNKKEKYYALSKNQKRFVYAIEILIFICVIFLFRLAFSQEPSESNGWIASSVVMGAFLGWLIGTIIGIVLRFFNMIVRKEPELESEPLTESSDVQDAPEKTFNNSTAQESIERIDQLNAVIYMNEFQDTLKIMQKTSEPSTFFSRYDLLMERLDNMIELQQKGVKFTGNLSDLKKMSLDQENIADTVNVLIDNAYNKQIKKLSTLKTERGRENSNNRWYASFEPYFDKIPARSKTYLDLKLEALKEV